METVRPATLTLVPMSAGDVGEVLSLEREAFTTGWPSTAFERELEQNKLARYLVLREDGVLVGFAGLWLMVDEAHIVTVAVAPAARRRGFGRLLVHALLKIAEQAGAFAATLEVRESNAEARALYRGQGFHEVGRRKRYYSAPHEDAVIMTTEDFASDGYRRRQARLEQQLDQTVAGAAAALAQL